MAPPRRLARELPERDGEAVRLAGHLEEYRAHGGIAFALVRDVSGTAQVTLKKGVTAPELFATFEELPRESVVEVEGTVRRSAKANRGVEVVPSSATVVSRAAVPLPLGVVDRVNVELDTRLNHRVLDLRKPSVRAVFELRSALLQATRAALVRQGFLEVDTPKLLRQGAEGGATLFPVDYFGSTAYLAQSPQLYKQMLMGAGFERVFEIAPAFRAEPSDTVRHLTEFASFDAEMAYVTSSEELREVLEAVVAEAIDGARTQLAATGSPYLEALASPKRPFSRITFARAMGLLGRPGAEEDLATEDEKRIGTKVAEDGGTEFYFITDFPTAAKSKTFYAQRRDDRPELTHYFDLDRRGLELASGGIREHRIDRLESNLRGAGLDPAQFGNYLEAFRFGMPPHGGWGFGIDRLVQSLAGLSNIREARFFPRDRYRLEP